MGIVEHEKSVKIYGSKKLDLSWGKRIEKRNESDLGCFFLPSPFFSLFPWKVAAIGFYYFLNASYGGLSFSPLPRQDPQPRIWAIEALKKKTRLHFRDVYYRPLLLNSVIYKKITCNMKLALLGNLL